MPILNTLAASIATTRVAHCWPRMLFGAPCKGNSTLHLACNSAFQAVQLTVSCSCLEMMAMSERGSLASEGGGGLFA